MNVKIREREMKMWYNKSVNWKTAGTFSEVNFEAYLKGLQGMRWNSF